MCAPVSINDDLEQTVTAFDLAEIKKHLIATLDAHEDLTVRAAINGETSAQLRAAGIHNPNAVRSAMENAIDAYRATCRNAFARTSGTYADAIHLKDAQDACIDRNNRGALRTAMRRVDAVEAAERSLIAGRIADGAAINASLPPYDAGAVAPCADLTRTTEDHPYGKGATPASARSHAAYEASFHPSSAA